ncbi:hypothetical protein GKR59_12395 [Providencia alcalifaciens]|nr:hypothetical protein [Providencia alcalifaciens]
MQSKQQLSVFFSNGLTYLTSFFGQYSPDNLYGIERISIGGQYSVRGYHEQALSGNRGGYWRNEINKDIANTAIGQLRFIGALDYGFISSAVIITVVEQIKWLIP